MYPQIVHVPLLFHFHQPVGQFGWVYEEAYKKSYYPLISFLSQFPNIKANLHFSGPILEWLDNNKPEFFSKFIIPMIDRKQIEIVTGGYYEPILISIPDDDKIEQVNRLNNYWTDKTGKPKPRGLWLTERVWEPALVKPLVDSGVEWVLIDDENFELNTYGVRSSFYPVITEDQGKTVKVLAINEQIRYLIPWKPVQDTFKFLKSVRDSTDPHLVFKPLIVIMSDAEKMGLWPAGERSTYDICYGTGFTGKPWIQELFEMLDETPWILSCTISEYFDQYKNYPLNVAYFKTESYDKMGVWALPTQERREIEKLKRAIRYKTAPVEIQNLNIFLKGAHWRSFIAKYPESNVLHKKMLFTRSIFTHIQKNFLSYFNEYEDLYKGYDRVLQAQCNDVYWHGQFGGIYYRFMREFSHGCLIEAFNLFEKTFEKQINNHLFQNITLSPILLNGTNDAFMNSTKVMLFVSLADGGTIFSLDDKEQEFNYTNVFTRIIESYHPEKGIPEKGIVNDPLPRRSFRDYFFASKPSAKAFFEKNVSYKSFFHNSPYEILHTSEHESSLTLKCISTFRDNVVEVHKSYKLMGSLKKIHVSYDILNLSDDVLKAYFIPELNFILPGDKKDFFIKVNNAESLAYDVIKLYSFQNVSSINLSNVQLGRGIQVNFLSDIVSLNMYSILSHEYSESLSYHNYQGSCLLPAIKLHLETLKSFRFVVELELL